MSTAATIIGDIEAIASAASNPISGMLAGVKIASTALPTILTAGGNIVQHLPDLKAKFADLEAKLQDAWQKATKLDIAATEADIGAAWKDGMAMYDDVGLPRSVVQTVIAAASTDNSSPAFVKTAIAAGESIAKQLGLRV